MPKILATIFLVVLFISIGLPLTASADGAYQVNFCKFDDKGGVATEKDNGDTWKSGSDLGDKDCPEKNIEVGYSGFVPCGKCINGPAGVFNSLTPAEKIRTKDRCGVADDQIYLHCQLCHFFVMINQIVNFLLTAIIPAVAVLMLVIGGAMFYLGGARPDMIARGRKLVVSVLIGLLLIYGAYMIIGTLLTIIGAADMQAIGSIYKNGVFSIDCPILIPTPN